MAFSLCFSLSGLGMVMESEGGPFRREACSMGSLCCFARRRDSLESRRRTCSGGLIWGGKEKSCSATGDVCALCSFAIWCCCQIDKVSETSGIPRRVPGKKGEEAHLVLLLEIQHALQAGRPGRRLVVLQAGSRHGGGHIWSMFPQESKHIRRAEG